MLPTASPLSLKKRRAAFALVAVLSFTVLLSILLTSFLMFMQVDRTSTQNYGEAAKSKELALGALEEIKSDLLAEIEAGSKTDAVFTQNDVRIYYPKSANAAIPAKIGFRRADYEIDPALPAEELYRDKLPPTVIRASRAQSRIDDSALDLLDYNPSIFVTPPANRASAVSAAAKSANGRWITPQRWNQAALLGELSTTELDKHPIGVLPPDWVYVTRAGSRVCSDDPAEIAKLRDTHSLTNADAVIGRYAFVMYDEGGLLDINTTGYPAGTSDPAIIAEVRGKSRLAYAALQALPGLSGKNAELNELVQWRNAGSLKEATFPEMVREAAESGFLESKPMDSPILGRRDLIQYFKAKMGTTQPLLSLGTFSRAVTAPTWGPTLNSDQFPGYFGRQATTVRPYATNSTLPYAVNPLLPVVRFDTDTQIIHHRDDGTIEPNESNSTTFSYIGKAGEPLVSRRFSLAKLAWIGHNGPNKAAFDPSLSDGQIANAIHACFGLRWETTGAFPRWVYDHGDSNEILTLTDVKARNRVPDFFELLNAGILNGSLGKHPGTRNLDKGNPTKSADVVDGVTGLKFEMHPTNEPDFQILQIGANIIDQYDSDSFPTAIYIGYSTIGCSAESEEYFFTAMGTENIPYILRMWNPFMVLNKTDLNCWWGFELWNPHRAPATPPAAYPAQFRIRAYGAAQSSWATQGAAPTPPEVSPVVDYDANNPARHLVFIDDGSKFRAAPKKIVLDDLVVSGADATPSVNYYSPGTFPDITPRLAGIHSGEIKRSEDMAITLKRLNTRPSNRFWEPRSTIVGTGVGAGPLSFVLQYQAPDGSWRPASMMARQWAFYRNSTGLDWSQYGATGRATNARPDPRTDRFSTNSTEHDQWNTGKTMRQNGTEYPSMMRYSVPRVSDGFYFHANLTTTQAESQMFLFASNQKDQKGYNDKGVVNNSKVGFYTDPDGVVRPGDGFRQITTGAGTGEGALLFSGSVTHPRKPIVLDRPFRSVAELGEVFRDLPFRSLDFWSKDSADAGLLDLFCLQDEPKVVSGLVNLNAAPVPVLKALLAESAKSPADTSSFATEADAEVVSKKLAEYVKSQPLMNRGELVMSSRPDGSGGKIYLADAINDALASTSSVANANLAYRANKNMAEGPVRVLSQVANQRTWNLLIDVIAQSGQMAGNAKSLNDFVVKGERRYWLHLAVDRLTGKIVDQQLEAVYE